MKIFNLYISGLSYLQVKFNNEISYYREFDPFSGNFLEWMNLSEEVGQKTEKEFHLNVDTFLKDKAYLEANLTKSGEIHLPRGERYSSDDGLWFYQRDVKHPLNLLISEGSIRAAVIPVGEIVYSFVEEGYENETPVRKWHKAWPDKEPSILKPIEKVDIKMRDGINLSTLVLLPEIQEPVPAILIRTPYGKEGGLNNYYRFVQYGYAVIVQDVRGRNESDGEWNPFYYEVEDGDDTISWISQQDWCTGKVGMIGGSYLGYVQWAALASGNPNLKAMVSIVTAGSPFMDMPRKGGSLVSGIFAWAFAVSKKVFSPELMERSDWDDLLDIRPLEDIPKRALGYEVPFLRNWLSNHLDKDYWDRMNWYKRSQGMVVPTLIQSGWFDDNGMGTTEALDLTENYPKGSRKVILGPWQHSGNSRYTMHGVEFGHQAILFDIDINYFRWFEKHLKGTDNGIDQEPTIEYYTLGTEEWKKAETWPIENSEVVQLYLSSNGSAQTSLGDGKLEWSMPEMQGFDSYKYDPKNPATHIIDMSENEISVPEDYTEEEKRSDYLVFNTEPLEEDITITGDMLVKLYFSSDAVDTDFVVRITDVDENGKSIKLADGVLGAKYRKGFDNTSPIEPNSVHYMEIRTSKISNCFKKGHMIRLTITSSAKNLIFPNSNTELGFNSEKIITANNKIYHGGKTPSTLEIRVER